MKKKVSESSTERNGPNILIPISVCAGMDLERNISTNSERRPGLVLYVRISMIIRGHCIMLARLWRKSKNALCGNLVTLWKPVPRQEMAMYRNQPYLPSAQ